VIASGSRCKSIAEAGACRALIDVGLNIRACGCYCADVIAAGGNLGEEGPPEPEPEPEPEP